MSRNLSDGFQVLCGGNQHYNYILCASEAQPHNKAHHLEKKRNLDTREVKKMRSVHLQRRHCNLEHR